MVLLTVILSASVPWPATAQGSAQIEQGQKLFEGLCARCHGYGGTGGEAPTLNRPNLSRAADEETLRAVIRDGIPGGRMPRVRRFTDNELNQLVGYVRSLGRTAPIAHTGNAAKGAEIYNRLGCAACHITRGQGHGLGPELTEIGAMRSPEHLRKSILDPSSALPQGVLAVPARGFTEFLPVFVLTRDGKEVRGVRINEDSFTIQLRDAANRYYSFRKSDVQLVEKEFGKSMMPSFKDRLTATETDDLVAFLSSLGGAK